MEPLAPEPEPEPEPAVRWSAMSEGEAQQATRLGWNHVSWDRARVSPRAKAELFANE